MRITAPRACTAAVLLALVLPSAAAAAQSVTGKVRGAAGYTLLEIGPSGATTRAKLSSAGSFKLPAVSGATLQLLGRNGRYFGPVVLAHRGTRGWERLSGKGLQLGTITLRKGYAAPLQQAPKSGVWAGRSVRVNAAGAPIGAGRLGFIPKSHHATARIADAASLPPGADTDGDGIPNAFDADVTGAGIPTAENAQAAAQGAGSDFFSQMNVRLENSLNADAAGVSATQLSQSVHDSLRLAFGLQGQQLPTGTQSVRVDCSALLYCAGTTVTLAAPSSGLTVGSRWDGTIPPDANNPGMFTVNVAPNAQIGQINPGDTFLLNYQTPSGIVTVPSALTTYFVTEPALSSIGAGSGSAAASAMQPLSYPATNSGLGTQQNPVMMTGDSLHLSLWRPQRQAFPGESGELVDMGHLRYGVVIGTSRGNAGCQSGDYSDLSPTLTLAPSNGVDGTPANDSADDAPPSSANQLGFTLNLNSCLTQNGQPTSGSEIVLQLTAQTATRPNGGSDNASQMFFVCLPGCTPGQVSGPGGGPGPGPGGGAPAVRRANAALSGLTSVAAVGP